MEIVYFIQAVNGGPIKIGRTFTSVDSRLAGLQTGNPAELRVVGMIQGASESELHAKFAKERLRGEWFTASKRLRDFVAKHASNDLKELLVHKAETRLRGDVVPLPAISKPIVDEWCFDYVWKNDENLEMHTIVDAIEFDPPSCGENPTPEELAELDDDDDHWCVSNIVETMTLLVIQSKFISSICVNTTTGRVCFLGQAPRTKTDWGVIDALSSAADDCDALTGDWKFSFLYWMRGRHIGIDLLRFCFNRNGYQSGEFDPEVYFGLKPLAEPIGEFATHPPAAFWPAEADRQGGLRS